ncbi:hypothetical protein JVU11DRAFT_10653 [Chiua virens]|nr:hypothetical protein JVU11DRAFT_10653 [Chiua virens]
MLLWLNPTIVEAPDKTPKETNPHENNIPRGLKIEGGIEPEHTVLIDYLTAPSLGENDIYEDTDERVLPFRFIWEVQKDLKFDPTLIDSQGRIPMVTGHTTVKKCATVNGFPSLLFESLDISQLSLSIACLNDVCINGCIPLLFSALMIPVNHNFTVFSTHHLTHIQYHTSNHILWKSTAKMNFWKKDIWIIPIHRPLVSHWVLCITCLSN